MVVVLLLRESVVPFNLKNQDFVVLLQAHRRSALLPTNHQLLHSLSQVVYLFVILEENKELLVKFLDFSLKSLQSTLFSLSKVADVDR